MEQGPEQRQKRKKTMEKTIKIKYHSQEIEKLTYIAGKSDWIDLRVAENVKLAKGEFRLISMGVSMQIPAGYEMLLVPRSSTYKNFGLIQTNSMGVIDESYCGDNDIIRMPVYATRDTELHVNDRICQFRILEHQPVIHFEEQETLGNSDRGGFGSTGVQ
jgi:dUTP pyrophosphatase